MMRWRQHEKRNEAAQTDGLNVSVGRESQISQAALDAERRQAMSYSISTLLTRNLHDVFGENDPARRRAAIDEIYTARDKRQAGCCP